MKCTWKECLFGQSEKHYQMGFLLLRIGLGLMMMIHGWPKIAGGMDKWAWLGGTMANLGITFAPAFWGFCAAAAEFFGGLCLAVGFLVRPASLGLAFTMAVALIFHINQGDSFNVYSHPLKLLIIFVALALMGGGCCSIDAKIAKK